MSIRKLVRAALLGLAATACATMGQASTVSGVLGVNSAGGPYAAGFTQLKDLGTATIVAGGPELQRVPNDSFDFSNTGMTMSFYTGANGAYSFMGYIFTLTGMPGPLTSVNLTSNSTVPYYKGKPALSQSDITVAPDGSGFAIALNSGYRGSASVAFTFGRKTPPPGGTPSPVPVPAGLPLIGSALAMLGLVRRKARR